MPAGFLKINRDSLFSPSLLPSIVTSSVWPAEPEGGQEAPVRRSTTPKLTDARPLSSKTAPVEHSTPDLYARQPSDTRFRESVLPLAPDKVDLFSARPLASYAGWFSFLRSPQNSHEDPAALARRAQACLCAETALRARHLKQTQRTKLILNTVGGACLVGALVALPLLAGTAGAALPLVFLGLLAGGMTSLGLAASLTKKIDRQREARQVARDALAAAEHEAAEAFASKLDGSLESLPEATTETRKQPAAQTYQAKWKTHLSRPTAQSRQLLLDISRRMEQDPVPPVRASWASSLAGAAVGSRRLGLSKLGEHSLTAAAMTAVLAPQMLQVFFLGFVVFWLGLHKKLFQD